MPLDFAKYEDDDAYYVVNPADHDASLNSVDGQPTVLQEFRLATIDILLAVARRTDQYVIKVTPYVPPRTSVKGYVTFPRFLEGCDLGGLERRLGFRSAILAGGAYLYTVNTASLNRTNIAPRGNTDWSAGVSPRDLANVSEKRGGSVSHHRDYPPASEPIIQFAILTPVPCMGAPRFIAADGKI